MEKRNYLLNVVEYMTLIILFMINNEDRLFGFTLTYLLYKVLFSIYKKIDIKKNILKYKNKDNMFRNKGYIYSIIVLFIYGILGMGISFLVSLLLDKVLTINKMIVPLIVVSIVAVIRPFLDITRDLLLTYNKRKLVSCIHYIYYGIDSILTIVIYAIICRLKMPMYIFISMLYIPKIIAFVIVTSLCLVICYKKKTGKNKYSLFEFREVWKDVSDSLVVSDSVKYGYFYISFIILYIVLVNRYAYKIEDVYNIMVVGYLGCLNIILLISDSIKYFTNRICSKYSLGNKLVYLLEICLPLVIWVIIMAKYIYMLLFGNIDSYSILMSFSLLILFIVFYDIMEEEYLRVRRDINKYLIWGIVIMAITIVPFIDSFYRMGYNLINGSIVSTILGISITLILLVFKIKPINRDIVNKYFEKFVMIIYRNIILCFVLVVLQLFIKFNSSRMFSLIIIVIYIGIMLGYFKFKKRGIKDE